MLLPTTKTAARIQEIQNALSGFYSLVRDKRIIQRASTQPPLQKPKKRKINILKPKKEI
jgi:hypothetical protein